MLSRHIQELRRLFAKFREGTLTTLEALNGYLFFYLDCSFFVIPGFALWFIDSENQLEYDKRIFYVTAGFFILFFVKWMILFSRTLPVRPSILIRIYRLIGSISFAALFSFVCGIGYFIFWNAITGSGEPVLVKGPIVHMKVGTGGRLMRNPYFVSVHYGGRDIELTLPPKEYGNLSLGQTYSREMKLGGLGYYYNWGSKWWK
ncbi:MAG: hypothetical protein BGO99_00915 [Nitrosospira sp. 56-18]|jgi:hypothetical protein|nr:hypothetical protein [Nitrosospira sp.]OJY13281.1 MAG: hypothetical protein BGO99_00915 [Nitrosospira sp. 56-18]